MDIDVSSVIMSFPPISPDSLDGSRMRLDVYIYIRNVQWVPKLYRRRTCFYISRISSFLLFCWIGSKNTLGTIFFPFFKKELYHCSFLTSLNYRFIIAPRSATQKLIWNPCTRGLHYVAQTWTARRRDCVANKSGTRCTCNVDPRIYRVPSPMYSRNYN